MDRFEVKVLSSKGVLSIDVYASSPKDAKNKSLRYGKVVAVKKRYFDQLGMSMSVGDRIIFLQRLSSMVSSRVGVSESLYILQTSFTGTVSAAASTIRHHVEAGASLAQAMTLASSRYFPESVIAIIDTGSQGGDLALALREAAKFEKEMDSIRRSSRTGLISALSGFVMGLALLLGSTLFAVPYIMDSDLIKHAGDDIDIGWVMMLADGMTYFALLVFVIFMAGMALKVVHLFSPSFADRCVAVVPFYKDLFLSKQNYITLYGLSVLLRAGLRIEEAFRLARDNARKGQMKDDFEKARLAVISGKPWPNAMRSLHPTDVAALRTAENREQIATTIYELSLQYKSLYQQRIEAVVPAMQLLSITFLSTAGIVLFGVVMVPLMQMSSSIVSGGM